MATISATQLAQRTRQSANWGDAKARVVAAYREWIRAAPQIQVMYSIPKPVATIRTRIRQEFERHRFVNQLPVVDKLITKSAMDYQETMNYWRQMTHMMSYFQDDKGTRKLPSSFMQGFLEGRN